MGADKTQVTSFAEGFDLVGEEFGTRYPPSGTNDAVAVPTRRVLYVGAQGARVRVSNGRVLVESADDAELLDVPQSHVGRLVCWGSVGVSAGFRSWALAEGIETVLATRRGAFLGLISNPGAQDRADRLRAQLDVVGTGRQLTIGRSLVEAKLRKQIVVLRRFGRRDWAEQTREATSLIQQMIVLLPDCRDSAQLMGMEGSAARAYFGCLGTMFQEDLRFMTRSRRPPQDVANAALSLLYTVLLGEAVSALHAAGLDPAIGVLHVSEGNRPSLALDVMEEMRPFVVDPAVLRAARTGALTAEHGRREDGGGWRVAHQGRARGGAGRV